MASSVTVPGGSFGTTSLTFATAATATLATDLLAAVYGAGSSLVVGSSPATTPGSGAVAEYIIGPTVTGSVTIPAGYTYILDAATGSVSITGNGGSNETFVAASAAPGGGFYLTDFGSGTVVAGSGTDTIINVNQPGVVIPLGDATFLMVEDGKIVSTGPIHVGPIPGDGGSVTITGAGVVFMALPDAFVTATGNADTIIAGGGTSTIAAVASGGVYFDLAGALEFIGNGASTVVAGAFTSTIFGGTGTSAYFTGGGNVSLLNAPGATSYVIGFGAGSTTGFNGAGGLVELFGAGTGNTLIAGAGAETLAGPFATGGNLYFAGSGADLIYLGGAGHDTLVAGTGSATVIGSPSSPDVFGFISGSAGGSDTIFNFNSADIVALLSYGTIADAAAMANQTQVTGGVQITLPDKTTITIAGIATLSSDQVRGS